MTSSSVTGKNLKLLSSQFQQSLLKWYESHARDLPWRKTRDPYLIWISEIMLQQTTVRAVIPYYERWIQKYPTVNKLARASVQSVLKCWEGLGYYNRARNLHRAARLIVKCHGGKIPNDPGMARQLPGFGPYTVGAVLSIAFDSRLTIIDANVRRVVIRLLMLKGAVTTKQDRLIREFLEHVLPVRDVGSFNQALMELGALVCRSNDPDCPNCPLRKFCAAYHHGIQNTIPQPVKNKITKVKAAIAIIQHENRLFIQKRPPQGLLAGLWEFPGGKIEKGETPREALKREVFEELGVRIKPGRYLFNVQHAYTKFNVDLSVWLCQVSSKLAVSSNQRWCTLSEIARYPMPAGSIKILQRLRRTF